MGRRGYDEPLLLLDYWLLTDAVRWESWSSAVYPVPSPPGSGDSSTPMVRQTWLNVEGHKITLIDMNARERLVRKGQVGRGRMGMEENGCVWSVNTMYNM